MIGDELRAVRKKAGLSQEELAERAGIHRTYVSLLERNRKSPTLDVLFRVCRALRVRASVVIARVERKQN
jgi:transcriptional regulator with XRE-family HTH domain